MHEENDAVLSQDVGKAGTGAINLLTGYLRFTHDDFIWNGNRMPITIQHIYNGNLSDKNFGIMKLGYGWKLNYQQKVIAEGAKYLYYDDRAIVHVLSKDKDSNFYIDENDENLKWDATDKILIKDNLSYKFDTAGNLCEISDSYGNKQTIIYDSIGRIDKISDAIGRIFQFQYNGNNELLSITDPDGGSVIFT